MTLAICRQVIDTEVITQVEILGRRLGLAEEEIRSELSVALRIRDQLNLLRHYTKNANLSSPSRLHSTLTAVISFYWRARS